MGWENEDADMSLYFPEEEMTGKDHNNNMNVDDDFIDVSLQHNPSQHRRLVYVFSNNTSLYTSVNLWVAD